MCLRIRGRSIDSPVLGDEIVAVGVLGLRERVQVETLLDHLGEGLIRIDEVMRRQPPLRLALADAQCIVFVSNLPRIEVL